MKRTLAIVAGCATTLSGLLMPLAVSPIVYASTAWNVGDLAVAVSNGDYQIYSNAGVLKETISGGFGGFPNFTTGCAWNNDLTKLYTTNFSNTKVEVYDDASPHAISQTINTGAINPGGQSESIVFAANGDFYVGHPDGNDDIQRYNSAGVYQQSYNALVDNRGTDWLDLAGDQKTMFYTSEGRAIQRYDVSGAGAQLADFALLPGGGNAFALRLLPPGDGTGGLLVADGGDIKRLDGTGLHVQTYDVAGEDAWFSLNLDPNGTSFWAGDFGTANFYRFNIATGVMEFGPINTGTGSNTLFGICLKGEPTAGVPKDEVAPEIGCVETINPHGQNVPKASKTNEDGFYELFGKDNVDPSVDIYVQNLDGSYVFGPYASGDKIKLTEAPGAVPTAKKIGSTEGQAGAVLTHITLNTDAMVTATDAAGNTTSVMCLVPPPPK